MKKLLILGDYPLSSSQISGGVSSATYNLVNSLIKYTDIYITTVTFWPGIKKNELHCSSNSRINSYRFPRRFKFRSMINYAGQRHLLAMIIKKNKPEIIHAQGEDIYTSLAINSSLPNVFTIHGARLVELEIVKESIGYFAYFNRRRRILKNQRKSSNIIAINEYTRKYIDHLKNKRIRVIRNAVDEVFFDINDNGHIEVGNILMAGGIRKRKDVITALKVIKNVSTGYNDIILNIVGVIEKEYGGDIDKFIVNNNLNNKVIIHGLVSAEKLYALYKKSDIFLMTSIEESSPISIVEAMAAGKPIVSTNVGGISEIIAENQNGFLLNVKDDKQIAEAIIKLVRNRELREKFAEKSRNIALADWSPKSVALKTYQFYEEILNGK